MTVKYLHLLLFTFSISYATAALIDLNCEFRFHEFATIGKHYTCFAKNDLKILDSNTTIENILGVHKFNQSVDSITALSIDNVEVNFFPSNLSQTLSNLVALKITNAKLKELRQTDLELLTKLKYLNLDRNNIEVLDDGLFKFNSELKLIWFYNNKIKSIGSSVFNTLANLSSLDLSNNVCISKKFANFRKENINETPRLVPRVLTSSMLSEINKKCSSREVESDQKIETTTTLSNEQIYQEKISKLDYLINSKKQEELDRVQKQQNILTNEIHTESAREYEANKKIFKLETNLKVEEAKVIVLKEKLSQKESELRRMSDDLSKAHESIRRFEEEIARNYATLRRADRSEINQLEAEKAEMNRKIGELLKLINVLRQESEAEIRKAKNEIEGLKILLFQDETQEIEIIESRLDESPSTKSIVEIETTPNEDESSSIQSIVEVKSSSIEFDTTTRDTLNYSEVSTNSTMKSHDPAEKITTAEENSDKVTEKSSSTTIESYKATKNIEPNELETTTGGTSDDASYSSESTTLETFQDTETEENTETLSIETPTGTDESENYSETDYLFSTTLENIIKNGHH